MLIANIYINYWAENKEKLQLRDKKILYQIEEQKKIYNTNDLFKKNKKNNEPKINVENCKELTVTKKENIINKIIKKIKGLINLT